jgi:hypothetical protein
MGQSGKTSSKQMFSAILPTADIRQGMLKLNCFTLQMPACCTICARSRHNSLAFTSRGNFIAN